MRNSLFATALISAFSTLGADAFYTKNSPVLQVSGKDFSSLIENSNHTSIVEFYAPWCGHCQNLKPAYEKAAKSLAGLAKVAAVNCDEEPNKPLCGQMGIQGFPTLKIVKPGSKRGKPVVEDYQGPRTAKGIVDAVTNKIPNHVKKVQDADLAAWLEEGGRAKAILFTEKGTTGALLKALAVDFLGVIDFATIRNKETAAVEQYGITEFPTVILIAAPGQAPSTYDGEMKKDSLIQFFAQVARPNPDPAPKEQKAKTKAKGKGKTNTSKKDKAASSSSATASSKFSEASAAHKSADFESHMNMEDAEFIDIELNEDTPIASPLPIVQQKEQPAVVKEAAPALPHLTTAAELESACLSPKSGNCILLLLPVPESSDTVPPLAAEALASFAEVAEKHHKRKTNIFPFYGIPADNEAAKVLRQELNLKQDAELEVLAINVKRKWWRKYPATGYDIADAETFVDAIRLGEGAKEKLPAGFRAAKVADEPVKAEDEPIKVEDEPVRVKDEL